ncbi:hypothetical protein GGX14DRAFT_458864 [Mycena pura]|uniref:F-box domain-containing protein n=1 Tax=Mycena pura TaxID=153505 RepID=A0AAD6Y8F6_9AGAR|nr:hypothetical protein GGX14DRAFT_458864 [Mycena pura]
MPTARSNGQGLDLLPFELWERIFSLALPDDLLILARVCLVFRDIGIRIHLRRHGLIEDTFAQTQLHLTSHILRALALQLPTKSFPAHQLVCQVEKPGMYGQLRCVRDIVARSRGLVELSINFGYDLFLLGASREAVMRMFCSIISLLAGRIRGPLVVLSPFHTFTCRPQDVADWKLHQFQFNYPSSLRRLVSAPFRHGMFRDKATTGYLDTKTQYHTGHIGRVAKLTQMRSATLRLVRKNESAPYPPCSILTLDADDIGHFSPGIWSSGRERSLARYLGTLLCNMRTPRVTALYLRTDSIDPTLVRRFLADNPAITVVEYHPCHRERRAPHMVMDPPLAHPGVTTLHTHARGNSAGNYCMGRFLSGLITSPNLRTVGFHFTGLGPYARDAAGLLSDLRCLAARGPTGVCLEFQLSAHIYDNHIPFAREGAFWTRSHDARAVAGVLTCVRRIHVWASSLQGARLMLEWVALLPSVQDVWFEVDTVPVQLAKTRAEKHSDEDDFRGEFRAALVHVPALTIMIRIR